MVSGYLSRSVPKRNTEFRVLHNKEYMNSTIFDMPLLYKLMNNQLIITYPVRNKHVLVHVHYLSSIKDRSYINKAFFILLSM